MKRDASAFCIGRSLTIAVLPWLLSACSTFSFAPPRVEVDRAISKPDPSRCGQLADRNGETLQPNVAGATALVDNFVRAYRCASHEAVDGRQVFEVPSMLALVAAAVGPTFGLTNNGRIAAAASAAVLGRGNGYFAPKQKAHMIDAALDAVLCVKTQAVGVKFFDTTTKPADVTPRIAAARRQILATNSQFEALKLRRADVLQRAAGDDSHRFAGEQDMIDRQMDGARTLLDAQLANLVDLLAAQSNQIDTDFIITRAMAGSSVKINVSQQYFETVSAALFSVERVLAMRLSSAGTGLFDAASLSAELEKLINQKKDQEGKLPPKPTPDAQGNVRLLSNDDQAETVDIEMKLLQTNLQTCVLRAKLT